MFLFVLLTLICTPYSYLHPLLLLALYFTFIAFLIRREGLPWPSPPPLPSPSCYQAHIPLLLLSPGGTPILLLSYNTLTLLYIIILLSSWLPIKFLVIWKL